MFVGTSSLTANTSPKITYATLSVAIDTIKANPHKQHFKSTYLSKI